MCIFCDIIDGKIPSTKVYENDKVLCIRDINPVAPTHVLVLPKKHFDDIIDISGYNTGDLAAGALVQVIYQAQVSTDKTYCKKTLKNTITASYNSNQNQKDSANVVVVCEENPTPAETCETNPNLPGCKKDCTTNPELPECQEEETCKTNPNLPGCQEIPSTGPVEIVLASVVAAGILGGGLYLYKTRKTLKSVESAVKGEDKGKEK